MCVFVCLMVLLKLKSLPGRNCFTAWDKTSCYYHFLGPREHKKEREDLCPFYTTDYHTTQRLFSKVPWQTRLGGGLIPQWSTGYKLLRANGIMLYFKQSNCLLQKNNYISSFNTENDLPIYVWWEATIFQDIMVETFT